MNELSGWISAKEAAVRLKMHRNGVLKAVREGRLTGQKIGGRVLIHEDALAGYRRWGRRKRA